METSALSTGTWNTDWPAPAKLNLFLHIVGRRDDGYHLLQTVFRFIDLADTLRFSPRDDGEIILATPTPGVPPEQDLTVRAAHLLRQASGYIGGVTIQLEKRLPMGGGLGGGSSDAATVLLALNHLWQTGLSRKQLETLGLSLGADVPVFIHGHNTFAEGVGERFTDIDLPAQAYLVVQPAVHVPTAAIFSAPELCRNTPQIAAGHWQVGQGHNDLQPVACRLFPEVARALAWLSAHLPGAMMTGSGACIFAPVSDTESARQLISTLPEDMRGWLTKGLDMHPLANIFQKDWISLK